MKTTRNNTCFVLAKPGLGFGLMFCVLFFGSTTLFAQNMSINANGAKPDNSAMLDVQSTSKGLLIPRMSLSQRSAITGPAQGLLVFQTDGNSGIWMYDTNQTGWIIIATGIAAVADSTRITDADNDTKIQVEKNPDEDIIRFDIDGTEYFTMDSGRFEIHNTGNSVFIGDNAGRNDDGTTNNNTFVGQSAGETNTSGANNTFIGFNAGKANSTGNSNVFVGPNAGLVSNTSSDNTFMGAGTGQSNTSGANNTFYGAGAGSSNTIASNNTFLGRYAGNANTTGANNIAIGNSALMNATAVDNNTAIGYQALANSTGGVNNTAIGYQSMVQNTGSGYQNTAIGVLTLAANTSGYQNSAVGMQALAGNSTGSYNVAMGYQSLIYANANFNTAIGFNSMDAVSSGANNTSLGAHTFGSLTTGSNSVAVGYQAGASNSTGDENIFLGYQAGFSETGSDKLYIENSSSTTPLIYGDFANDSLKVYGSLSIGDEFTLPTTDGTNGQVMQTDGSGSVTWQNASGNLADSTRITDADNDTKIQVEESPDEDIIRFDMAGVEYFRMDSGRLEVVNTGGSVFIGENAGTNDDLINNKNTFIGQNAGYNNTTGYFNTFSGAYAGQYNTTGYYNTFSGSYAGKSNTTGYYNTFSGYYAGQANTTGAANFFGGPFAGGSSAGITGSHNIGIGYYAASALTSGDYNIMLGRNAGKSTSTGSYNIMLGFMAGEDNTTGGYNLFQGYSAGRNNTTGSINIFSGYYAGFNNTTGDYNIFSGYYAGYGNTTGSGNTNLGLQTNYYNQTGSYNTAVGYQAGRGTVAHSKTKGVYVGYQAGYSDTNDNRLYIENSNSSTPLIYGDFANDSLKVYGSLSIGDEFTFPTVDGTNGQVMTTNGSGVVTWGSASDGDWTVATGKVYNNSTDQILIGNSTAPASYKMEVETPTASTYPMALSIDQNYTGASQTFGATADISSGGTGLKYGFYSLVTGNASQTNDIYGTFNQTVGGNTETVHGTYNAIVANGKGTKYGSYSNVSGNASQTNNIYGSYNNLIPGNTEYSYGVFNSMSASGTGSKFGVLNSINGSATQSGSIYGTYTSVTPGSSESSYGEYVVVSSAGTGNRYGSFLYINASSATLSYGQSITMNHNSTSISYGESISFSGSGTGARRGLQLDLGTGSGTSHGLYINNEDYNYLSGSLGIGTTTPSAELDVVGDIEIPAANDYTYSTAKTQYRSVSHAEFTIAATNTNVYEYRPHSANSNYFVSTQGGTITNTAYMVAPINLPDGAIITNFAAHFYDNDGTYNCSATLIRQMYNGFNNWVVGTIGTAGTPYQTTLNTSTLSYNTIDNSAYTYHILFTTQEANGNLGIYGARITYTVTNVD